MLSATRKWFGRGICTSLVLLGLCVVAGGCGGKDTADVSGKVMFKGKPLEFGSVNVFASDDKPYMGEIQSDGSYVIKKVPLGPARACVECTDPKVREEFKNWVKPKGGSDKAPPRPNLDPKKLNLIPEAYGDPQKSKLKLEVKGPTTTYDITLEDKGPG